MTGLLFTKRGVLLTDSEVKGFIEVSLDDTCEDVVVCKTLDEGVSEFADTLSRVEFIG